MQDERQPQDAPGRRDARQAKRIRAHRHEALLHGDRNRIVAPCARERTRIVVPVRVGERFHRAGELRLEPPAALAELPLEREIGESRRWLEAKLGRPVDQFAYPNGDHDARALACVRRHYAAAVTVDEGFVSIGADALRLPRVPAPWNALRLALVVHREPRGYLRVAPMTASGSQVAI